MRFLHRVYQIACADFAVRIRYERYKRRHWRLHRAFPFLSWAYLLFLAVCRKVLRIRAEERLTYPESSMRIYPAPARFLRRCAQAKAVAFQVVGTLLLARSADPIPRWNAVGYRLRVADYPSVRREAAAEASRRAGGAATQEQVCAVLQEWLGIPSEELCRQEQESLRAFLIPNPYFLKILPCLRARGQRVLAVDETGLPAAFWEELLAENGLSLERVYAAAGGQKLWRSVRAAEGDSAMYVGSDAETVRAAGRRGQLFPDLFQACALYRPESSGSTVSSVYASIVAVHLHAEERFASRFYEHGFAYGGILVYGFCSWLDDLARRKRYDGLLFLARDAQILYEIYRRYFGSVPSYYLSISRLASMKVVFPQYSHVFWEMAVRAKARKKASMTVREALEQVGLGELLPLPVRANVAGEDRLDARAAEALCRYLSEIRSKIAEIYAADTAAFEEYFAPMIRGKKRVCVVDLGWRGTIFTMLAKYVERTHPETEVRGAMVGTTNSALSNYLVDSKQLDSYLFSHTKNVRNIVGERELMLLETLFSSAQASTVGYRTDGDGVARPVFGRPENARQGAFEEMRRGMSDFCALFHEARNCLPYPLQISAEDAYAPIRQINRNRRYNLALYGDLNASPEPNGRPVALRKLLREMNG